MNDPQLSAYTRRMLARLGPFLNDEEREFVAMSLHDAIHHIIVECDYDKVHVSILEFLMRITFAWKHHKREQIGEKDSDDEEDGMGQTLTWGQEKPRLKTATSGSSSASINLLMFDDVIFKHGMSAEDFQAFLNRITMLPRTEVEELLGRFFEHRAVREDNASAEGSPSRGQTPRSAQKKMYSQELALPSPAVEERLALPSTAAEDGGAEARADQLPLQVSGLPPLSAG